MYLYLSSRYGLTYIRETVSNIKVVVCPFCGVSTSNGEILSIHIANSMFRCITCQIVALSSQTTKPVTKEEVEKLHPHIFVADGVKFYLVKIYKIVSITDIALINFAGPEIVTKLNTCVPILWNIFTR